MTDDEILSALRARIAEGRHSDLSRDPVPPPTTAQAVAEAERVIGYPLPPLLRRIYLEVANGGIGPFTGIDGVSDADQVAGHLNEDGSLSDDAPWMIQLYVSYLQADLADDEPPPPPRGVLFICDYGCAMSMLLDCRHPEGQMWWWEGGNRYKLDMTFPSWVSSWLEGTLPRPPRLPELRLEDESWFRPEDEAWFRSEG